MPVWNWNADKDELLRRTRGISFDDVVYHIEHGDLLAVVPHRNQERYPGQHIFIVRIGNYAYEVPFVGDEESVFLKTIYPSRKAVRDYLQATGGDYGTVG